MLPVSLSLKSANVLIQIPMSISKTVLECRLTFLGVSTVLFCLFVCLFLLFCFCKAGSERGVAIESLQPSDSQDILSCTSETRFVGSWNRTRSLVWHLASEALHRPRFLTPTQGTGILCQLGMYTMSLKYCMWIFWHKVVGIILLVLIDW